MKKILLAIVAIMTVVVAQAQRIEVVDSDGNAVAYATVLNAQAEHIGITNLDGMTEDLGGAKDIAIMHVAFKTKNVRLNGKDMRVTLEDADFEMPEITVSPKPLVYVQTYYRVYMYSEKDGITYYRAGLTDNVYDINKKQVKASHTHVAKAKIGLIKVLLGSILGNMFDKHSRISARKLEERMKEWGKTVQLKFNDEGPGKKRITDYKGTIGYITDDKADHQRRYSFDTHQVALHRLEAEGKEKALTKRKKRDEKKKNRQESDFYLYHIDDAGNYAPEDFIMSQDMTSWDEEEDGKTDHVILSLQVFSTDRAYVTKKELKQRQKDNKMKLNYENILKFEREHNIPPLAPAIQQRLAQLWKVKE